MKKFIIRILVLFSIIVIADRAIGYFMDYVVNHIEIGGMGRDNYICKEADEDILIFGSSRAVHHYNAKMLEDSLGLSCYNCGDDSNGVILNYGRLLMLEERKLPKLIIFDLSEEYDLEKNDNTKYLGWLRARYDYNGIPEIFDAVDEKERIKMMSYFYRFNTRYLQNLVVFLSGKSFETGIQGFRPLKGEMDTLKLKKRVTCKSMEYDSLKLEFIQKFIDEAKGAEIKFIYSPIWYGSDPEHIKPVLEICKKNNIDFIDFSNNTKYVHNSIYFKDGIHLNSRGADEFTKDLIRILKGSIN